MLIYRIFELSSIKEILMAKDWQAFSILILRNIYKFEGNNVE